MLIKVLVGVGSLSVAASLPRREVTIEVLLFPGISIFDVDGLLPPAVPGFSIAMLPLLLFRMFPMVKPCRVWELRLEKELPIDARLASISGLTGLPPQDILLALPASVVALR